MITVIHGDDIVSSRNYFVELKQKSKNPASFDTESLTKDMLFSALENMSLFNEDGPCDIFIENLFAKNNQNSAELKKICSYLDSKAKTVNVYIWQQGIQSKTNLGLLKKASARLFKENNTLFYFLDNLKPGNTNNLRFFHEALKTTNANIIFVMIIRQFRLLLALSDNSQALTISELEKLAPWQKSKLEKQKNLFTKDQLIKIYQKLGSLDKANVTGQLQMPLESAIDFFLLEI